MENDLFVNLGIDIAFKKYINNKDEFDFLSHIVKILMFIYGEENIITFYENNDYKSFEYLLLKYNVSSYVVNKFFSDVEKYYTSSIRNKALKNSIVNPYFTYIQEDLIDMFIAKYKEIKFDDKTFAKFKNYLFTPSNEDINIVNFNKNMTNDQTYIENYYESKVFSVLNPIEFSINRSNKLPQKIYDAFNLSEEDIKKLSHKELENINNRIFNHFKLSPIIPNVEEKLLECVKKLENESMDQSITKKSTMTKYMIFGIILLIAVIITVLISNFLIGV